MPLITCPECGKDISETALTCPNCGYTKKRSILSIKNSLRKRIPGGLFVSFVGMCIVLLVVAIYVIALLILTNPSEAAIYRKIEEYSCNGYKIPYTVARELLKSLGMVTTYELLHYLLNIASCFMSVFAIIVAVANTGSSTDSRKNNNWIAIFSAVALIFTTINFIANPKRFADTSQYAYSQMVIVVRQNVYDNDIPFDQKTLNIIAEMNELGQYYNHKMH